MPLFELLVRYGATRDARDDKGRTALDVAREVEADELAAALSR